MAPIMAFFSPSLALMTLASSEKKKGWGWGRGDELEGEVVLQRAIMRQRQTYMVMMSLVFRQPAMKSNWRWIHNFLQGWLHSLSVSSDESSESPVNFPIQNCKFPNTNVNSHKPVLDSRLPWSYFLPSIPRELTMRKDGEQIDDLIVLVGIACILVNLLWNVVPYITYMYIVSYF